MSTILVTGAGGFVAGATVPELLRAGHRVVGLVHDPAAVERVRTRFSTVGRDTVEILVGDVTRPETLGPAFAGVDAVLHLAAIPRDRDGGRSLHAVNTDGTAHMLAAATTAGVRRFVHQGALGVIDDPALHYASSKARAEALVRDSGLD